MFGWYKTDLCAGGGWWRAHFWLKSAGWESESKGWWYVLKALPIVGEFVGRKVESDQWLDSW